MVKRAFLLLALAPVLLLAGCDFFTASLFPGYLAQTEKSFDLGSNIDGFLTSLGSTDYRWYSQVFVLTSSTGADYGGVLIEIDSLSNKRLLMLDPAGGMQFYDGADLRFLHLLDANSQFVVGQRRFDPGNLTATTYISGIEPFSYGFSVGSTNYLGRTDGGVTFYWNNIPNNWTGGSPFSVMIDYYGSFELRGMYYDANAIGREVVLVFFDHQSNRLLVIFTPFSGINCFFDAYSGLSGSSLRDAFPDLEFGNVDPNNVLYTRKGIVLVEDNRAELMDAFSGSKTGKSLDLGQSNGDIRLAIDLDGDDFYVFSTEDQTLYQGNTGW